jgi:hypothetical protein
MLLERAGQLGLEGGDLGRQLGDRADRRPDDGGVGRGHRRRRLELGHAQGDLYLGVQ